ncbi:hypothetical protein CAEBREN_21977 [Caenorhabditis brenneri]|uniref:F-box domain-containing protein n=1 Tax=Caenorhabditis brenneri TaxID=135651 RepID=G0P3G2_CAEBE|nr:hypothetical protein CAEBREN_21977 [Caenorhabditis brenneri]
MSEVFETNEIAYRSCILYEAVRKTPLEDAYKNMKEVKPNVEYSDFEYWYYRFSNGQHDLKHDRSKDPKSLGFSDMPIDVVDNIIGYLGLVDKLSTRKVCRQLRAVIDKQSSKFGDVGLTIDEESCEVCYEDSTIEYSAVENENCLLKSPRKTISLKGDDWMMALEEFASVITHPKWSFQSVSIVISRKDSHPENERKLLLFFNSLLSNHQIHVDSLYMNAYSFESLAMLLPHFKTDTLSFCPLFPLEDTQENLFEAILKMDRWKNLTKIHIDRFPDGFPIEALFHVRECDVRSVELTENRLTKIRDILFKTPTFAHFEFRDEKDENREDLPVLIDRVMGAHDAYNSHDKVYRIENSKDYIQISIKGPRSDQLDIRRIRS